VRDQVGDLALAGGERVASASAALDRLEQRACLGCRAGQSLAGGIGSGASRQLARTAHVAGLAPAEQHLRQSDPPDRHARPGAERRVDSQALLEQFDPGIGRTGDGLDARPNAGE
jgi:hypothetical protein